MYIASATLKSFRCFTAKRITFSKPLVLIEGLNGIGKTSLLEALHYACYLRSFRTRIPRELIAFNAEAFSITVHIQNDQSDTLEEIHVGCSSSKRLVKVNDTAVTSYKELINLYRVITITDDDLFLIKGTPDIRRSFIDNAISLIDPTYPTLLRRHNHIVDQRNALLHSSQLNRASYDLWTDQLLTSTQAIRTQRITLLAQLEERVTTSMSSFFNDLFALQLTYKAKREEHISFDYERLAQRTLIGAHLDDFTITMSGQTSKQYASRGQQQLLAILLKIASAPTPCIFLIDDALSDLDSHKLDMVLQLLMSFKSQVIITSPLISGPLTNACAHYDFEQLHLT